MGVDGYFKYHCDSAEDVDSIESCRLFIANQYPARPPTTLVVDHGFNIAIWISATTHAASNLSIEDYTSGDFVEKCRQAAIIEYNSRLAKLYYTFQDSFEAVYIVHDNSEVEPIAKAATQEKRRRDLASAAADFQQGLETFLHHTSKAGQQRKGKHYLFARYIHAILGGPPLPRKYAIERQDALFWRNLSNYGITHIIAMDEADLAVSRCESALGSNSVVVYSADSDLLALVNSYIIRPFKGKYQVFLGQRSQEEMARAGLVGNDYTAGKGCPGISWSKVAEKINIAKIALDDSQQEIDATSICRQVLSEVNLEEAERSSIIQSVQIWMNRSHLDQVQPRSEKQKYRSEELRESATSKDIGTLVKMRLPFETRPMTKVDLLVGKCNVKSRARRPGRTQTTLRPLVIDPIGEQAPQYEASIVEMGLQAAEERRLKRTANRKEKEKVVAKEPSRAQRKDLGLVFPRRSHTDRDVLLVNNPIDNNGSPLFSLKKHPLLELFRLHAVCLPAALDTFTLTLETYLYTISNDFSYQYLLSRVSSNDGLSAVLDGILAMYDSMPKKKQKVRNDVELHRSKFTEEQIAIATKSTMIDAAMLEVRFGPLREHNDFPSVSLIPISAINLYAANMEMKIRTAVPQELKRYVQYHFSGLQQSCRNHIVDILLRTEVGESVETQGLSARDIFKIRHLLQIRDDCMMLCEPREEKAKSEESKKSRKIMKGKSIRYSDKYTPIELLEKGTALPLYSWWRAMCGKDGVGDSQYSISGTASFWGIAGQTEMLDLLRRAPLIFSRLLSYYESSIKGRLKILPKKFYNKAFHKNLGRLPNLARWEADWSLLLDNLCHFIGDHVVDRWNTCSKEKKASFRSKYFLATPNTNQLPIIYYLAGLFRSNRFSNKCILSGVISTDGYQLSLGLFDITRGRTGVATSVNNTRLTTGALDFALQQSISSVLLGRKPVKIDGAYQVEDSDKLIRQLKRLNCLQRVKRGGFLVDKNYNVAKETRNGLPAVLPAVRQIESLEDQRRLPPRANIGVDLGERILASFVYSLRGSITAEDYQAYPPIQSSLKGLLVYSSKTKQQTVARTKAAKSLEANNHINLAALQEAAKGKELQSIIKAAKWEFKSSKKVLAASFRSKQKKRQTFHRILEQFLALFEDVQDDETIQVFVGNAFGNDREGAASSASKQILCFLWTYCRNNLPNVHFFLTPEHFTSQCCPNSACNDSQTGKRALMKHPQNQLGRVDFRSLQCPTCLVCRNRDTVGASNMIETGLHFQEFGKGLHSGY